MMIEELKYKPLGIVQSVLGHHCVNEIIALVEAVTKSQNTWYQEDTAEIDAAIDAFNTKLDSL